MQKQFYDDLLVVLILTLLTVICLLISGLNLFPIPSPFIYICYILLLLFLPGYSLVAAKNQEFAENSILKRVGLSIVVSLVTSILLAILLTYTPLKVLNSITLYIVAFLTIILSVIAILRRRKHHYVRFIEPDGQPEELDRGMFQIKKPGAFKTPELRLEKFGATQPDLDSGSPELNYDDGDKLIENKLKLGENEEPDKQGTSPKEVETKSLKLLEQRMKANKDLNNPDPEFKPPRRFAYLDLIVVLFLTILCTIFILHPNLNQSIFDGITVNSIIGLFLILFLPGYALIAIVYPKKDDLNGVARLVLSFGVSYFLTSVIGLVLNYTPLGNNLNPILLALSVLSFVLIGAAFLARVRIREVDRFQFGFGVSSTRTSSPAGFINASSGGGSRNRNILLVGVVALALLIATPTTFNLMNPAEKVNSSTEFYVLGPDGNNISTYPANLTSGENGTVTIVLVNHENTETSYRIVTNSNQTVLDEINVTLKPNEKKEIPYNFTVGKSGTKKIELLLYKLPNVTDVYLSQSFWLTILELVTETDESGTSTDTSTYQPPVYEPPVYEPEEPVYEPPVEPEEPVYDDYVT